MNQETFVKANCIINQIEAIKKKLNHLNSARTLHIVYSDTWIHMLDDEDKQHFINKLTKQKEELEKEIEKL